MIAMVDALFTMAAVRIAVIGEPSFAELLAHQFADSGVRGFVFATSLLAEHVLWTRSRR